MMNKRFFKITLVGILSLMVLSACGSKWNVKVDITPEERAAAQTEITDMKTAIQNFKGPEGEIPNLEIARLAKAYEKLGDRKSAIDLYNSWLKGNVRTKTIINNLGRLYEQVGETELAVKQYQRIIDEYFDTDYLYDITWAYIHAAQASTGKVELDFRKKAEKYFNIWQLEKKKTDDQTQTAIKGLREKEAAVQSKAR
jgi:tetratricopeptide (TPR) repeat protein